MGGVFSAAQCDIVFEEIAAHSFIARVHVPGPDGVLRDYARAYELEPLADFTVQAFFPHIAATASASAAKQEEQEQMFQSFLEKIQQRGIAVSESAARELFARKVQSGQTPTGISQPPKHDL